MKNHKEILHNEIARLIDIGKTIPETQWSTSDIIAKLFEEGGEFSRAIQIKRGKIDRIQPATEDFDECADVIICAIDALARVNNIYNNPSQIKIDNFIVDIGEAIRRKSIKWKSKYNENIN